MRDIQGQCPRDLDFVLGSAVRRFELLFGFNCADNQAYPGCDFGDVWNNVYDAVGDV
jgi:hypothetical protein